MKFIQAKTILTINKDKDAFGGVDFNMNLYRGCLHNCIYCYSRSGNYYKDNFEEIEVKQNAHTLLEKELSKLNRSVYVSTGSMNDPYMEIEADLKYTKKAIEILKHHHSGVLFITKSDLIMRDSDIIKDLDFVIAGFSITTANDDLAKKIEINAPTPSNRFKAMKKLADNGIYTGTFMMPVLPFIEDNWENIKDILDKTKQAGGSFVLPWLLVSLRDKQKEFFYKKLDENFPNIREKYEQRYNKISCYVPNAKYLYEKMGDYCLKIGLDYGIKRKFISKPKQLNLFF